MGAGGAEGIHYWAQWQVPLCGLILAAPAAGAAAILSGARVDPLRSTDLWIPGLRRVSPWWLLAHRALALVLLSCLLFQVVLLDGAFAFYFYTQWTTTLVIIYFLIATIISARGCWGYLNQVAAGDGEHDGFLKRDDEQDMCATSTKGTDSSTSSIKFQGHHLRRAIELKAGFLGYIMQIIYQASAGAVVLTDIVFWGVLVPFLTVEHFSLDLLMGCMHSVNAAFLLLDTALNSMPFPWFRMAYFVIFSCVYVIFQWILHACGFSWWPYPFLELSTPWAPLWYFCLALIHIPCFGLYSAIVKAKSAFFAHFFSHSYVRSC